MQFVILLGLLIFHVHVSLPCPPADLVQEDLWARRSPEIQVPPGNTAQTVSTRTYTR